MSNKPHRKAEVTRYACPVEDCDVMVYVTYDPDTGSRKIADFGCDRQGKCGIPLFDPCPLYIDLVERRGIRK